MFTKSFQNLSKVDVALAGGKGASLGEMIQANIPVPLGFVVLSDAFERFIEETDLNVEIDTKLHKVAAFIEDCDAGDDGIVQTSHDINNDGTIDSSEMYPYGEDECVVKYIDSLCAPKAVRALAVDLDNYIWAGLFRF